MPGGNNGAGGGGGAELDAERDGWSSNGGDVIFGNDLYLNMDTATINLKTGGSGQGRHWFGTGNGGDIFHQKILSTKDSSPIEVTTIRGTDAAITSFEPNNKGYRPRPGYGINLKAIISEESIFDCQDLNTTLSQQLTIDYTWTITCEKNILGNGYTIAFGPNGAIVIDGDIDVKFDNLEIKDLSDHKIRCINGTEKVTLQTVDIKQDGNYTFSKGELVFMGECSIDAPNFTFKLEDIISPVTIASNTILTMLKNSTLEYDTDSATRLVMADATSTLYLSKATLLARQALTISTGILDTDGLAVVYGIGTLDISGLSDILVRGGLAKVGSIIW